jgi:phosphate transport system protein
MTVRARHQPDLARLQLLLLRLAESIDRAMIGTHHIVLTQETDEAAQVLANDLAAARLRAELESEAHRLLAQQPAPLGEDLRSVTAALILADELCRIGNCATTIATLLAAGVEQARLSMPAECSQMAYRAREILQGAMRAVITRDAGAVERLRTVARRVDALYQSARQTLLATIHSHVELSETAVDMLLVANQLKLMADCGVHIAERAAFIATGSWPASDIGDTSPARVCARDAASSRPEQVRSIMYGEDPDCRRQCRKL